MGKIKQKEIDKIPTWYFPNELNKEGDVLIQDHMEKCDLIIQIHGSDNSEDDIRNGIKKVRELHPNNAKIEPIFIHVYPAEENTITIYGKNINGKEIPKFTIGETDLKDDLPITLRELQQKKPYFHRKSRLNP